MSSPACSIRATSFPVSSCHDKFVVDTCSLSPIGISNVGAFRSESFNVVVVFYLQASGPQRIETAFSVVPFSGLGAFCASFSATKFTHARHFHIISAPNGDLELHWGAGGGFPFWAQYSSRSTHGQLVSAHGDLKQETEVMAEADHKTGNQIRHSG